MGEVYQAWDPVLDRCVALKRVRSDAFPDSSQREMLLEEARTASSLQHRAIVSIYDVLEVDQEIYLVEEFATGTPLRRSLRCPFELKRFFDFGEECVDALVAADANGIIHCDLKPENILVSPDGRPRILDFGIARRRVAFTDVTTTEEIPTVPLEMLKPRGTPAYLAPELLDGNPVDARADIFSLGVVFYEILTTVNPFRRDSSWETLQSVRTGTPLPPSSLNDNIPSVLDRLVMRMLEKDPDRRPDGPAELLQQLRQTRQACAADRHTGSWFRRVAGLNVTRAIAAILFTALLLVGMRSLLGPDGGERGTTPYVVLGPFETLAAEGDAGYLAAGFLEAVEARLSSLGGVYFIDPESEIDGKMALEGSLQRVGERIRFTFRLVDRESGITLGGDLVEGQIGELFDLQDRVTDGISTTLEKRFNSTRRPESGLAPPTDDAVAYELYLQGRGSLRGYEDPANIDVAIELFEKALGRDPDFALAHAGLADAYWRKWEETKETRWTQRAEESSLDALERGPDLAAVHVTLGTIYRERGQLDRAAREFERAIGIDQTDDAAYVGLANAYEAMGRIDAAIETFEQAVEARPDYWANMSQLGAFHFRIGNLAEAQRCFERVVELTPANPRGYSNLGAAYVRLGDLVRATESFERSIEVKPNYRAYSNLAFVYRAQNRLEEAAETFGKALVLDPRDYRVWASLGATYNLMPGRKAAADSSLRRAIELAERELDINPRDPVLLSMLGQYYGKLGEPHRARRLTDRALEIAPEQIDVLFFAAVAFVILKDEPSALASIEKALEGGLPVAVVRQEPMLSLLIENPKLRTVIEELEGESP